MDTQISSLAAAVERVRRTPVLKGDPKKPTFSKDADSLFFYTEDVAFFACRVDDLITVFRAVSDRRIIGIQVKGMSALAHLGGFEVRLKNLDTDPVEYVIELLLASVRNSGRTDAEVHLRSYMEPLAWITKSAVVA